MALDPVVNFFRSTIATLPVASGGTSIVLQTGDGNKLPAPAIDGAFNLTIYNADDPFVAPEIVRVTARSGDTLTVTRAQEGTSATNKTAGSTWNVELTPTAKTIQDIDSAKLDVAGGTMTGDLTIPDKIIHSGDTNTAIRFPSADTVTVETAGTEKIRATSTAVVVNETGGNFDFRVEGDTDANLLFVDASADKVGIGKNDPATALDVTGAIRTSTGILFGTDTAAANTLDDYEEGTWTPVYSPASGSFATLTMDIIGARFTKIGNTVYISALIRTDEVDVTGASGSLSVDGLPFTALASERSAISIGLSLSWNSGFPISAYINPSSTLFTLHKRATVDGQTSNVQVSDMTDGVITNQNYIIIGGTYLTS